MLRYLLKIGLALVCFSSAVFAEDVAKNPWKPDQERYDQLMRELAPTFSAERYHEMAADPQFEQIKQTLKATEKAAVDAADVERQKQLKRMGIDNGDSLIIAVTTGMPKEMLKSYIKEAMWYGGRVVVRGIPKGMKLMDWVREVATPLVADKVATAGISLNPELFDLYGITTAPTIVWDERKPDFTQRCLSGNGQGDPYRALAYGDEGMHKITKCPEKDEGTYYKVTGAVTIDWALEQFSKAGANNAETRRKQGAALIGKAPSDKEQTFYEGDWHKEPLPPHSDALEEMIFNIRNQGEELYDYFQPFLENEVGLDED